MKLIAKTPEKEVEWAKPANSWELIKTLNVEPTEGVVVAIFPSSVESVALTGEKYKYDKESEAWGIIGDIKGWGTRLLDIVTDPAKEVKWWKVREFGKVYGYDLVPDVWNGGIQDMPQEYFDADEDGTFKYLGVRFYNYGPWFWPLERPKINFEEDPDEVKIKKAAENLAVLKEFSKK